MCSKKTPKTLYDKQLYKFKNNKKKIINQDQIYQQETNQTLFNLLNELNKVSKII